MENPSVYPFVSLWTISQFFLKAAVQTWEEAKPKGNTAREVRDIFDIPPDNEE